MSLSTMSDFYKLCYQTRYWMLLSAISSVVSNFIALSTAIQGMEERLRGHQIRTDGEAIITLLTNNTNDNTNNTEHPNNDTSNNTNHNTNNTNTTTNTDNNNNADNTHTTTNNTTGRRCRRSTSSASSARRHIVRITLRNRNSPEADWASLSLLLASL